MHNAFKKQSYKLKVYDLFHTFCANNCKFSRPTEKSSHDFKLN